MDPPPSPGTKKSVVLRGLNVVPLFILFLCNNTYLNKSFLVYTFLCIEIERFIQGLFKPWFYSLCKKSENYIFFHFVSWDYRHINYFVHSNWQGRHVTRGTDPVSHWRDLNPTLSGPEKNRILLQPSRQKKGYGSSGENYIIIKEFEPV